MTIGQSHEGVFQRTVDEAVALLQQGLSVHIVGPHGSGRSELLQLLSDRLDDDGWSPVRLHGNVAWRQDPFSALLAAGLGPAPAASGQPPARRTSAEMAAALGQQLRRPRTILLVDDADDLDVASVGALLAVRRTQPLLAVTTSCPPSFTPEQSLVAQLQPSIQLRPPVLDADEVNAVAVALLGGPVDAPTLARLTTFSAGLAGIVRAMVTIGRTAGTLREDGGVWTAADGVWSPHVGTVVEPYLAGLDQDTREALTTLASVGAIPVPEAVELLGPHRLSRLVSAGLAQRNGDLVGTHPPILAEHLRRTGAALFGPLGGEQPSLLPTSSVGSAVGADVAIRNQRLVARANADVARLHQAWEAEPTSANARPLVIAMRAGARPAAEIEYVLGATRLTPDPANVESRAMDARLHSWHITWTAISQGRLEDALRLVEEAGEALPEHRDLFEVTRAHIVFMRDRVPDAPLLDQAYSPDEPELLTVVRIEILLALGRPQAACDLLDELSPTGRVAVGHAALLRGLAAVLAGDVAVGVAQARIGYQSALDAREPGLQQAHAYVGVLGLNFSGRLTEAGQLLVDALSAATVAAYRDVYHTGVVALGATMALTQGRTEYAAALVAQAQATDIGAGPYPAMNTKVHAARLAGTSLWPIVDSRIEHGYLAAAVILAFDASDIERDPDRAERVFELSRQMEGRMLPAFGDYVLAAARDDEEALAAAATALADGGALLYSARADVTRALLLRSLGRTEEAAALLDATWVRTSVAGLERSGLFVRVQRDVALSARELEIARLIAVPMTTQEVAEHLSMSARTVETHVHNAARKLGVSGREALTLAATTWLKPGGGA